MSKVVLVVRILMGVMFVFFGLNLILQFLKMPPVPGDAGVYLGILASHKVMNLVALLQIIAGVLLLVGRFIPLALTLLAPILANILIFHLLIAHGGALLGLIATVLELILLWAYRLSFRGIFDDAAKVS